MEKRGEILNQLAIISDLLEKVNLESESTSVIIEVKKEEFDRIYKLISNKVGNKIEMVKSKFSIKIGEIDIVFSTSNA
jgi:Holliday junction resolvase-like predicted endonuclease